MFGQIGLDERSTIHLFLFICRVYSCTFYIFLKKWALPHKVKSFSWSLEEIAWGERSTFRNIVELCLHTVQQNIYLLYKTTCWPWFILTHTDSIKKMKPLFFWRRMRYTDYCALLTYFDDNFSISIANTVAKLKKQKVKANIVVKIGKA